MINSIKNQIQSIIGNHYNNSDISIIVEEPKNPSLGDLSIPIFNIVKKLGKPLNEVSNEIISLLSNNLDIIDGINPTGGFINIRIKKQDISFNILNSISTSSSNYGYSNIGEGKNIVIDYSSPNIAKPFSIGHLRSTIIGASLKRIYEKCGYKVYSINHLGDWGSQFGKVIVAYKKWGNKTDVSSNSLSELAKLYVRFHEEVKNDPSLNDEARQVFKELENGNKEYLDLWKWFREESVNEAKKLYNLLGVTFDSYDGEAFFNDKMEPIVNELKNKKLLKLDDGAQIVELEDMPPALIKRSDGASLYITRDLAALFYRKKTYQFDKCLYVVGNEQKLHFNQLRGVVSKMGYEYYKDIIHIGFGLVLKDGKKMSTREGRVVTLYEVLMEACNLALKAIVDKNPTLENKDETSYKIGVGAVIFNDLKNHRSLDIEFNLDQMLKFEGQTGPYLQYTAVRISSILRENKIDLNKIDKEVFDKNHYYDCVKQLDSFKSIIEKSQLENAPSILAKYLLSLAQSFNAFYGLERIACENEYIRNSNLLLAQSVKIVIEEGMRILGLNSLERM